MITLTAKPIFYLIECVYNIVDNRAVFAVVDQLKHSAILVEEYCRMPEMIKSILLY